MRHFGFLFFLMFAVAPAQAACNAPKVDDGDAVKFFLGIEPSDDILDVWCRIQRLPAGTYKIDVQFPDQDAKSGDEWPHRFFETKFDGTASQDREVLASFIRSLFPAGKAQEVDAQGQAFPHLLKNTVQGMAPKTLDEQPLGLPPDAVWANELVFWNPVNLRVKSVHLADADFLLTITFKPQVGRWFSIMQKQSEDLSIRGAIERVVGGAAATSCPDGIPNCPALVAARDAIAANNIEDPAKTSVPLHTAWVVEAVFLEARGGRLSPTVLTLFNTIKKDNRAWVAEDTMDRFEPTVGEANLVAISGPREVIAIAKGDPNRSTGTDRLRVVWHERLISKDSYVARLAEGATQVRDYIVLQSGTHQRKAEPPKQ